MLFNTFFWLSLTHDEPYTQTVLQQHLKQQSSLQNSLERKEKNKAYDVYYDLSFSEKSTVILSAGLVVSLLHGL